LPGSPGRAPGPALGTEPGSVFEPEATSPGCGRAMIRSSATCPNPSRCVRGLDVASAADEEARFLLEVRPALKFESLIETMFTFAADGKTGKRGLPGPLRLAVIAREQFNPVLLPLPPADPQRA